MARQLPTDAFIQSLVNAQDPNAGFLYIPAGYPDWLNWIEGCLYMIAQSGAFNLQVVPDTADATTVRILPGSASTSGTPQVYAGGTLELSAFNNSTAYIYGSASSGTLTVAAGASGSGWPDGCLKLAEVTLAAGVITGIVDMRPGLMLTF